MIPEKHGKLTVIRDEDIKDLENIQKLHRIDFVMVPYILSKDDVKEVRRRLNFLDKTVIISRLDDKRSFEDFWEITNESGGIMLNRNSLSHSISPEKLHQLQNFLTEQCNLMGKPIIVETTNMNGQNLHANAREISDIELSVLSGIDVILLDQETSNGPAPVDAIKFVSRALAQAETLIDPGKRYLKMKR